MRLAALVLTIVLAVGCGDARQPAPVHDPVPKAEEQAARETPKRSSTVTVEDMRLTFDPKTCSEGKGQFFWSLGSVAVTVLGRENGMCVFDYQWEVEGMGNYAVHRVKVPIDSGPVVIEAEGRRGEKENHWSYVFTSFTSKQAELVRRREFGWDEVPVGKSGKFAGYRSFRPGDDVTPVRRGDRITVRLVIFLDKDFTNLVGTQWRIRFVSVELGTGGDWRWVEALSSGMKLYEIRRVRVPVAIAGPAKTWLPGYGDDSTIYAEMQLVAVERK